MLLWPWHSEAVHAAPPPRLVPCMQLLFTLNEWLSRTAVLAAPLILPPGTATIDTVDVALPLPRGVAAARGVVSSSGAVVEVPLGSQGKKGVEAGAAALGLHTALGCLRLLQVHVGGRSEGPIRPKPLRARGGGDSPRPTVQGCVA